MKQYFIYILKISRNIYKKINAKPLKQIDYEQDPNVISKIIYEKLMDENPCMIAKFGAFELSTLVNYLGVKHQKRNIWKYIKGEVPPWWWDNKLTNYMHTNAGFFPPIVEKTEQFCQLMMEDMKQLDVLGSWQSNEVYFKEELISTKKVWFIFLDPFWATIPWTKALEGKKVLVIHPFAELIEEQYHTKRTKLFNNNDILPLFELKTIKAVQSLGGENNGFSDWFEALDSMKKQIDKTDFDICLLGCGAYGFPLAAYIKSIGKKAFHIGGSLQLLFGIIGKRWEDPDYGKGAKKICSQLNYPSLINENWIRPIQMRTKYSSKIEDGCYW